MATDPPRPTKIPPWPTPVWTLEAFLEFAYTLSVDDLALLAEQAIILLRELYVHLPQKRTLRGIDPIQRLRLLGYHLTRKDPKNGAEPAMTLRQFHEELLAIFADLHDAHTHVSLPGLLGSQSAMLPFMIEECYEDFDGDLKRTYLVTKVLDGIEDDTFRPGVEVLRWNNVPIGRAIESIGRRQLGSNPEAQRARAMRQLTVRPMFRTAPPDELAVLLRYRTQTGDIHDRGFEWMVGKPPDVLLPSTAASEDALVAESMGIDYEAEAMRRVLKMLFGPDAMNEEHEAARNGADAPSAATPDPATRYKSKLPDVFTFRPETVDGREYGYLRIWTFDVKDTDAFHTEAKRILKLLPQQGLIVDVRANGGGVIQNAERLLQLLSPLSITPEAFQFVNTPQTKRLVDSNGSLERWAPSIDQSVENGAVYSAGFTITQADRANDKGQLYQGPVVLVVDGLCYSSTDTFAAGFQDHGVGKILGVHHRTGAGGGNVWETDQILRYLAGGDSGLSALPEGSQFRVAVRRNLRVRGRAGLLVEEVGVEADEDHQMTRNDVLNGAWNKKPPNVDLIAHAGRMLAKEKVRSLSGTLTSEVDGQVTISATFSNIHRIDAIINGRPGGSFPVSESPCEITVPVPPGGWDTVELRGYDTVRDPISGKPTETLVVATRVKKQP